MFLSVLTYLSKNNFFSLVSAGRAAIVVKKNNVENGQVTQLMLVVFYVALNPLIRNTPEGSDVH